MYTHLGIKSVEECRETEDGGDLSREEGEDRECEGPSVGVLGDEGPQLPHTSVVVRVVGGQGWGRAPTVVPALVRQDTRERDKRRAQYQTWKKQNL